MNKHRKGNSGEPESHDDRQADGAEFVTLTDEMAESSGEAEARWQELQTQLQEKEKELAELKDKYLRALADGENARKRIRQQSEESVRIQKEGVLRDLLPIVDNLERAVQAAQGGGNGQPLVEGVSLVLKNLTDVLARHGVTRVESTGARFDPSHHEAVAHVESAEHEPNAVIEEHQPGYRHHDRLLRPALVTVSKGRPPNLAKPRGGD